MDTSPEYIKMHLALPDSMLRKMEEIGCRWFYCVDDYQSRLFEQDQLQAMLQGERTAFNLLEWIVDEIGWRSVDASMEQLWLAFVMSELYLKQWDGEKWIYVGERRII